MGNLYDLFLEDEPASRGAAAPPSSIDDVAGRYGVPAALARALVQTESGGRVDAVSPKGARGRMQVMPGTLREMGVDPATATPEQIDDAGMGYLRKQYDRFGQWDQALAAYHAGPGAIRDGRLPDTNDGIMRTRDYVARIMGAAARDGGDLTSEPGEPSPLAAARQPRTVLDLMLDDAPAPADDRAARAARARDAMANAPVGVVETVQRAGARGLERLGAGASALLGRDPSVTASDLADVSAVPKSAEQLAYEQALAEKAKRVDEADGALDTTRAIADMALSMGSNPKQLLGMVVESLVSSLPALGGAAAGAAAGAPAGPVGATVGGIAGWALGSLATNAQVEMAGRLEKKLVERGIDTTNAQAMAKALVDDPYIAADARTEAIKAALATTGAEMAADAVTLGTASKTRPARTLLGSAARGAGAMGMQGVGEGAGAYAGEAAAGDTPSLGGAISEGLIGAITGAPEAGAAVYAGRKLPLAAALSEIGAAKTTEEVVDAASKALGLPTVDDGLTPEQRTERELRMGEARLRGLNLMDDAQALGPARAARDTANRAAGAEMVDDAQAVADIQGNQRALREEDARAAGNRMLDDAQAVADLRRMNRDADARAAGQRMIDDGRFVSEIQGVPRSLIGSAMADTAPVSRESGAVDGDAAPSLANPREPAPTLARPREDAADNDYRPFAAESGSLGVPRTDMPQVRPETHGPLVNFLKARGVESRLEEVAAGTLRPTQAEYSPTKVKGARAAGAGERRVLVSSDGYVVDGHHRWLAAFMDGAPVKVIRLDAPVRRLLDLVAEFPSASQADEGMAPAQASALEAAPQADPQGAADRVRTAGEATTGIGNRSDELVGQPSDALVTTPAAAPPATADLAPAPASGPAAPRAAEPAPTAAAPLQPPPKTPRERMKGPPPRPSAQPQAAAPIAADAATTVPVPETKPVADETKAPASETTVPERETTPPSPATPPDRAHTIRLARFIAERAGRADDAELIQQHRDWIEQALEDGKSVLPDVLRDHLEADPDVHPRLAEAVEKRRARDERTPKLTPPPKRTAAPPPADAAPTTEKEPVREEGQGNEAEVLTAPGGERAPRLQAPPKTGAKAKLVPPPKTERPKLTPPPKASEQKPAAEPTADQRADLPPGGEQRDADRGEPAAKRGAAVERGLPIKRLTKIVDDIRSRWANAPDIEVVGSAEHLPERVIAEIARQEAGGASAPPRGIYWGGTVYLVADQLPTEGAVVEALLHESLGHFGLRGVFGARLNPLLDRIAMARPAQMREKARDYGLNLRDLEQRRAVAEELLAEMAQASPELDLVQRVIAAIRGFLRDVFGLPVDWSDADIVAHAILPARRFVEEGANARPRRSRLTPPPKRSGAAPAMSIDGDGVDAQRRATERAYGGAPAYERAKAAGRTKLTFGQWVTVRTPAFKAWFGDWEAAEKARILQGDPVADVRTDQVPPGGYRAVEEWAADIFRTQGGKASRLDIGDVVLDRRAAKDSMAHGGANRYKKAAFAAAKDVIERGAIVRRASDDQKDSIYIAAPVTIDGNANIVTVLVHRDPNTQRMYLHAVTTKENLLQPRVSRADAEASGRSGSTAAGGVDSVLHDLLNFNLDTVSEAVDPTTGEPLVLYHGTTGDFSEFDQKAIGTRFPKHSHGFYATSSAFSASLYADSLTNAITEFRPDSPFAAPVREGANVMPVFMTLRNPMVVDVDGGESTTVALDENEGELVRKARRDGHDGVVVRHLLGDDYYPTVAVAFRPEQIKSATGNRGTFDPSNPDIRFSRARRPGAPPTPARTWDTLEASKLDDFLYVLQDKQIDLKRVVTAIREAGRTVADRWNAYLQEELYHGRTAKRVKDFLELELRPLLADMRMRGVTIPEFEEYLHNRHAEERNDQIAKVNPKMKDKGSGIATADAQAYLAGLDPAKRRAFDALAQRIDAISDGTRKALVDGGLEKQETIDRWDAAYKFYVPLMRDEVEDSGAGTGMGFSVRGAASRRAMGSEKPVVDILANLAMQRERVIIRVEKNRVATALYGLAVKNPNPEFWKPINPKLFPAYSSAALAKLRGELVGMGLDPLDAAGLVREPVQRYVDPRDGLVHERVNPALRGRDNVLSVRVNGEDRFLFFSTTDERAARMAHSLKNLDVDQLGRVLSASAAASRWFAGVNTQYNPIFGLVNLTRDVQSALFNLSTTPIAGKQAQVLGHTVSALRGIYADIRAHRAGKAPTSSWAQLWEEFQREGGQTGFRDMWATAGDRTKALESEIRQIGQGKARGAGRAIFNWLSDYNETLENATRLAAYKVALEQGISKQQAASIAKNLTVNFNRKGQITQQAGALFAFFNASVQGSARLAETLAGPMGRRIVVGGLTLGVVQAMVLAAAGFDDDDPPEFVRERNLVIPIGDKQYVTIPMPLGLHVLPGISRITTEWVLSGFRKPGDRVASMLGMLAETFNPIGNAGLSLQTITPTVVDPLAALAENKDFSGRPIARENVNTMQPKPGFERTRDTASWASKQLAYWLNIASGGTEFSPGALSPTPDQIDYLVGQITGGVGRELLKVQQTTGALASGEEIAPYKMPLVGRFYGDASSGASESARFYDNLKTVYRHKAEMDGRRRQGESVALYMRENPESRLVTLASQVDRDLDELRKERREAAKRGASSEQLRRLDDQAKSRMATFNRRVEALQQ